MTQHSQWTNRNTNVDHHILTALKQIQEEQQKFDVKLSLIDQKGENYKASATESLVFPTSLNYLCYLKTWMRLKTI